MHFDLHRASTLAPVALGSLLLFACISDDPPEATPTAAPTSTAAPSATATVTATDTPTAGPTASPTASTTPTQPPEGEPPPVPFPVMTRDDANTRRTGDMQIDHVLDALLGGDQAAVAALIRLTSIACTTADRELGSPPACLEGEEDGTIVEVFPAAVCEGFWLRDGPFVSLDTADASLAMAIPTLYRDDPAILLAFEHHDEGYRRNIRVTYVYIIDGAIVSRGFGCNTVEDLLRRATGDPLIWPVSFPDRVPPGHTPPTATATPAR